MSGYIKLHRAVRGTAIAQHPEYFAAWVHLLCMASHKPHQQNVGTKVVDLQPGQLVFGRQRFSATTGISENKVRASLSVLKDLRMITSKSHAKFSVITITNWSKYQESTPANNQHPTSTQPALNHEQEGSKNVKKKDTLPATPKGDSVNYDKFPDQPDPAILKDWLSARRKAKAAHTQTAMDRIGGELHKAKAMGFAVDDCLAEAATRTWRGFKAEWMKNAGHNTGYQSNTVQVSDPNDTSWADGFDPHAGDFENL